MTFPFLFRVFKLRLCSQLTKIPNINNSINHIIVISDYRFVAFFLSFWISSECKHRHQVNGQCNKSWFADAKYGNRW